MRETETDVKKNSTSEILKNKNGMSVTYWPSTEPSIKRCTYVNKRKNSGSRWTLNNNIPRTQTAWVSWRQDSGVRASGISDPRLSNPAKTSKKYCWVKTAVCPRLQLISHTQPTATLSRIKCERLYFFVADDPTIKQAVQDYIVPVALWATWHTIIYIYIYIYIYISSSSSSIQAFRLPSRIGLQNTLTALLQRGKTNPHWVSLIWH